MQKATPKIFVSYCHADISKAIKVEEDLSAAGLTLVRDERALGYSEDLESYMKTIRSTDFALILVSDAFLRSTNCMFEIHEFLKDESHQERVLPVILESYQEGDVERRGADIYSTSGPPDYVRYWQEREVTLRKQLEGLDISNLMHFARELSLIQSITKSVADFIFLLKRIKHIKWDDLVGGEYRDILQRVGYGDISTGQIRRARSLYSQVLAEVSLDRRLEYLTRAIQTFPSYVDALNKRGQVYDELKEYGKALLDYNRALEIAPDRAAVYISRSYAYIRQDKYEDALQDLEKALVLEPNHKESFNNRADVYRRLGQFEAADKDLRRALEIDPEFDLAYATLAEIAAAQERVEDFFRYLSRAVDLGFPLHKYSFDPIYSRFENDLRFAKLLDLSMSRNQRFI